MSKNRHVQVLETNPDTWLASVERSRLVTSNLRTLVRNYTVSGHKILAFDRVGLVPDCNGDLQISAMLYWGIDKAYLFKESQFMDLSQFGYDKPCYVQDHNGFLRAFVKVGK